MSVLVPDLQKLYDTHKILWETYHKYENYWYIEHVKKG